MPTPSLILVPARFKTGKLYTPLATTSGGVVLGASGDFNVTRATTATRVNASGNIEVVASGIPRLDYFASGGVVGCPALLVEPAATNGIRNNSMVGAVTGTPGTLPTNWSNQLGGGITQTIVGTGTENGVDYIDIRISGTQNNPTPTDIRFESTTQIVASNTQNWTESVYLKIIAAPNPPTDYRLYMFERTSAGVFVKSATQIASVTTTLTRFSFSRALDGGATVGAVQPAITFTTNNGSTYDFTIRIGLPQMEQSSVATSVIPTTTAAVTRNADVITLSGAVSGCIGQTEGTIYAEVDIRNMAKETYTLEVDDGVNTNRIIIRSLTSNQMRGSIVATTSSGTIGISSATFTSGIVKIAFAYKSGDFALSVNGAAALTASGTFTFGASLNRITLGSVGGGGIQLNDRIRAVALYTTRLTNAELAALTTL